VLVFVISSVMFITLFPLPDPSSSDICVFKPSCICLLILFLGHHLSETSVLFLIPLHKPAGAVTALEPVPCWPLQWPYVQGVCDGYLDYYSVLACMKSNISKSQLLG